MSMVSPIYPAPIEPPVRERPQAEEWALEGLVSLVTRRWRIGALLGAVVFVFVFAFAVHAKPQYEAEALVQFDPRPPLASLLSLPQDSALNVEGPRDSATIEAEIEKLRAPATYDAFAQSLRVQTLLRGRAAALPDAVAAPIAPEAAPTATEAKPAAEKSGAKGKRRHAKADAKSGPVAVSEPAATPAAVRPAEPDPAAIALSAVGLTGKALAARLGAHRRGATNLIAISARAASAGEAQALANAFADYYLNNLAGQRRQAYADANVFVENQLAQLRDEVRQKEAQISALRTKTGFLTAAGASLTEQRASSIQSDVLRARADLAAAEARARTLASIQANDGGLDTLDNALASDTIRALRDREAEIARRQSDLENRYLPTHPAVQAVRSERRDIEAQIKAEIGRIAAALRHDVDVSRSRLNSLEGSLTEANQRLAADNVDSVSLGELERSATALRGIYENLLARYQQLTAQTGLSGGDAHMAVAASAPTIPASPNKKIAFLVALIAACLAAGMGAVGTEFVDDRIRDAQSARAKLGQNVIAIVPPLDPRLARNALDAVAIEPFSPYADSLRQIGDAFDRASQGPGSGLDAGKRGVVAALCVVDQDIADRTFVRAIGRAAALGGKKVLVIDCRTDRPTGASDLRLTDSQGGFGVIDVISGKALWAHVITRDPESGAHFAPVGGVAAAPRDWFGADSFRVLLNELRSAYDLIILDAPPALTPVGRAIYRRADWTAFLAAAGSLRAATAAAALTRVRGAGGRILGLVLARRSRRAFWRPTLAAGGAAAGEARYALLASRVSAGVQRVFSANGGTLRRLIGAQSGPERKDPQ